MYDFQPVFRKKKKMVIMLCKKSDDLLYINQIINMYLYCENTNIINMQKILYEKQN